MTESLYEKDPALLKGQYGGLIDRYSRKVIAHFASFIREGRIRLCENGVLLQEAGDPGPDNLEATIDVRHPGFYRRLFIGGDIGVAEAYMEGWWTCDNLYALMRIIFRNKEMLRSTSGRGWIEAAIRMLFRLLHINTPGGSRKNIASHYDLGNDFFALFLDETMTYSCGFFEQEASSMREASEAKLDRLCRKLALRPGEHIIEIGTGWGSFALHAARHYSCRVTTTTISKEQHALARERVAAAGLDDKIDVLNRDYRDLEGSYDKLVSIEMIEAVGHQFFKTFFRKCADLLKPDGAMALQAITISDQQFEQSKDDLDFIKRYIFPGGCLPSVTAICESITRFTDLRLCHLEDISEHYVTTLHHWQERFLENIDRIRALGYPEPFLRMWEYYLMTCAGGFAERHVGDVQMLLGKPRYFPGRPIA